MRTDRHFMHGQGRGKLFRESAFERYTYIYNLVYLSNINELIGGEADQLRNTGSRTFKEVKQRCVWLGLGCETPEQVLPKYCSKTAGFD